MTDRRNISPADELGHIRDEIKRLKKREDELRAEMLAHGGAEAGAEYRVEVVEQQRRTLDRDALPKAILDDPAYWKTSTSRIVRVKPIRTEAAGPSASLIDDGDSAGE
jgi:hypothetical protein